MSVVQEAIARAVAPEGDLAEIEYEAKVLSQRAANLLPVENAAKTAITARMEELRLLSKRVELAEKTGLKMIPLSVLAWTRRHDVSQSWRKALTIELPVLALIGVANPAPIFSLGMGAHNSSLDFEGGIPEHIRNTCYEKVRRSFNHATGQLECRIKATFTYSGVIPDETREKIAAHTKAAHFAGGGIYLLCDAVQWKVSVLPDPKPVDVDPIVVGYALQALWMIDVFDPTPIEKYLSLEFSSTPQLTAG